MKSIPEIMVLVQNVEAGDVTTAAHALTRFASALVAEVGCLPNCPEKNVVIGVLNALETVSSAVYKYARQGGRLASLVEFVGEVGDIGRRVAAKERTLEEVARLKNKYN